MMSEPPYEPEVPVSAYGAQRRAEWLAGLQRSADMVSAAEMSAHEAQSEVLRAAHQGLFGHMTGEQMATASASHRVGDGTDAGRELERNGGLFDHANVGPAPARVYLRDINEPGRQGGRSPLYDHYHGGQ
jgi:hypothetical protein